MLVTVLLVTSNDNLQVVQQAHVHYLRNKLPRVICLDGLESVSGRASLPFGKPFSWLSALSDCLFDFTAS